MTKYRIRLSTGRVIGPFVKNQLFDLKAKGHILGQEEAQVFPIGDWVPLSSFDFYSELMDEDRTVVNTETKDETFVIDLETLRNKKNEAELDELKLDDIPVEEMTETIRMASSGFKVDTEIPEIPNTGTKSQDFDLDEINGDNGDRTLINPVAQEEIQKMRRQQEEELDRIKREEEEAAQRVAYELEVAKQEEDEEVDVSNDATQVLSLESLDQELLKSAEEEDELIEKEIKAFQKKRRKEEAELEALEYDDDDEDEDENIALNKASRKKSFIIIGAALAIALVFLFPGEDDKKSKPFSHLPPQVVFPIPFDKADSKAAQVQFTKGLEIFKQGTYPAIVKSGLLFKSSYENDLNNLEALSMMVRSYGEQLQHSKTKLTDSQTMFNIIQGKRPFLIQNANGTIGLNLFYMTNGKTEAAIDVVSRYLKLFPTKVTQDLFAVYLQSLVKGGKIDIAKQFFQALEKAPEKTQYTFEALIEYLTLNQETQKALEYIDDAIKRFPHLVNFYLLKSDALIKLNRLDEIPALLAQASSRNLEYNDLNRAKFLEMSGLYWAYKGDTKKATSLLNNSLKIIDSNSLRMKLAELKSSGGASPDTDQLIDQSKSYKLLNQAKIFFGQKNYELALSWAARASDQSPGHIPADLFLSKVQLKLGLARQGLNTLEELVQKYPDNKDINLALIAAYTETFKFHDAKNRIAIISSTPIRETWEYASVNGRLYLKMGDALKAVAWLKTSINANPLNDDDLFLLADILLKRSNFEQARTLLNKCMELDPVNPDYRIAYARMIYETQDDQAAIGYLLGLLDEFGEDPKFLSEIAIFYFRAGKVKDFQDYKLKLEKMPTRDKALYEFLIKAALLDERYNEIPDLVDELLKIEPGDLESMMTAGRVLFETGKLVEAARWFKRIQDKLPTYPKVQYYIAKIKFLSRDFDGALKEVQKDIKDNGENDASLVFLGEIYMSQGDLITAENNYKKAQKLNPRSYEALMGLADLSTKRNNFDLALDLYKKALNQRSDEPVIHKKIGDVYRLLGQGTLAIEAYKLYLEMDPEAADKKQIESYIQLMK